MSETIPFTEA
jgi:prevent-host-death family protein